MSLLPQALWDRTVRVEVFACFLAYPMLSARLLKLYLPASYGGVRLLLADTQIDFDTDMTVHHALGPVFLVAYIVGIPAFFAHGLWVAARPSASVDIERAGVATRLGRQRRLAVRFGVLYNRYRREAWWWELLEQARKLLLISVLVMVPGGVQPRLLAGLAIALTALLAHTYYMPYSSPKINLLNFVALLSTLLTLWIAFALNSPTLPRSPVAEILLTLQLLPLCTAVGLVISAAYEIVRGTVERHRTFESLPAVLQDRPPFDKSSSSRGRSVVTAVTFALISRQVSRYSRYSHYSRFSRPHLAAGQSLQPLQPLQSSSSRGRSVAVPRLWDVFAS